MVKWVLFFLLFASSLFSQVSLGAGSYATIPSGKVPPSSPFVTSDLQQKVVSNKWWSTLISEEFSRNIYAHPLGFRAVNNGLLVGSLGDSWNASLTTDLRMGITNLNATEARVSHIGHFSVSARWQASGKTLEATMGNGFPFVWFSVTGGNVEIEVGGTPEIWYRQGSVIGLSIRGRHYALFAPTGANWSGSGTLTSDLAGKDYLSLALLPEASTEALEHFRTVAYNHLTDTRVEYSYDESTALLTSNFIAETVAKEGASSGTVFGLLRHQWLESTSDLHPIWRYSSPRGEMKLSTGSQIQTLMKFHGTLPTMPWVGQDANELNGLLANEDLNVQMGDTYWGGKSVGKVAQLIALADQNGNTQVRDAALVKVKAALEERLTAGGETEFYYHADWNRLIGYPASYGSDERLSDHHFHYGYFFNAAAAVAQQDPKWAADWGPMLELVMKDVAAWNNNDPQFNRWATFDPYLGHGWADGRGFDAGNNQESTSESMNASAGMILWGIMTGNKAIRDQGIFLHLNENRAIEQYWWDVDRVWFPEHFDDHMSVGILWSNGGAYATWWTADVGAIHGIQLIPSTAAMLYYGRRPEHIVPNYEEGSDGTWQDLFTQYLAYADGDRALAQLQNQVESGNTRSYHTHHVRSLATAGKLNSEVGADLPSYAVFDKGAVRTYSAFNPDDTTRVVHFGDGFSMSVTARSQKTEQGDTLTVLSGSATLHITRKSFQRAGLQTRESLIADLTARWEKQHSPEPFRIYDLQGKLQIDESIPSGSQTTLQKLQGLTPGIYVRQQLEPTMNNRNILP